MQQHFVCQQLPMRAVLVVLKVTSTTAVFLPDWRHCAVELPIP
jgi:hypothetical protein